VFWIPVQLRVALPAANPPDNLQSNRPFASQAKCFAALFGM